MGCGGSKGAVRTSDQAHDARLREAITDMERRAEEEEAAALVRFANSAWTTDSVESLKTLLSTPVGLASFEAYLKTEYSDNNVHFFQRVVVLRARNLMLALTDKDDAKAREELRASIVAESNTLFERFVASGSDEQVNLPSSLHASATKWEALGSDERIALLNRAADETLRMMAMDCFPRFLQSSKCMELLTELKGSHADESSSDEAAALATSLAAMKAKAPRSRAEWVKRLQAVAQVLPVCVVISDMKAPDEPLCFVNDFFCKMTGYDRDEIIGKNCRFLQGDDRGQEAVSRAREAIKARRPINVTFHNFRKSGEPFMNLLCMKPIFDAEGDCQFYLGVQYPVTSTSMQSFRLAHHARMLELLPSKMRLTHEDSVSGSTGLRSSQGGAGSADKA